MNVQDTIYNWLTIKVVHDTLPDDEAAAETCELFENILKTEHSVKELKVTTHEEMYEVTYTHEEKEKKQRFPIDLINNLLNTIQNSPTTILNREEDVPKA